MFICIQTMSNMAAVTTMMKRASCMPRTMMSAVRIGKTTVKIVRQNIVLALGVKAIVLALGSAGFADLWAAVFADVGVALLAICNALRVQRAAK